MKLRTRARSSPGYSPTPRLSFRLFPCAIRARCVNEYTNCPICAGESRINPEVIARSRQALQFAPAEKLNWAPSEDIPMLDCIPTRRQTSGLPVVVEIVEVCPWPVAPHYYIRAPLSCGPLKISGLCPRPGFDPQRAEPKPDPPLYSNKVLADDLSRV